MSAIVEGPKIAALSCGKPVYLVVLLHGEGEDGATIIDHALNWAPTMIKADFLALEAPFPALAPSDGRQWLELDRDMAEATNEELCAGLNAAANALNPFLDEVLAARRLPDSHLALVGFSQGGMLALHAGLRREKDMSAIVSFSAALPDGDNLEAEITSRPPVAMIHGADDALVPLASMLETKKRLKAQGVPARSMRVPGLGHAIDDNGIIAAGDFLTANVRHKPAKASA